MVPGPRERRPKSSGSPIAYQVDRVEHLSPDKLFLGFWDFFLCLKMDQLDLGTCPGTQQGTWTHGRYTGSKFYFLRVDRTWVHLPGSQGRGPGYGRENFRGFFFYSLDMDPLHLGTLPGSRGRGPGSGGENFRGFSLFPQNGPSAPGSSTRFTGKRSWRRMRKFSGKLFYSPKLDRPRPGTRPWDPTGSWDSGRRARG